MEKGNDSNEQEKFSRRGGKKHHRNFKTQNGNAYENNNPRTENPEDPIHFLTTPSTSNVRYKKENASLQKPHKGQDNSPNSQDRMMKSNSPRKSNSPKKPGNLSLHNLKNLTEEERVCEHARRMTNWLCYFNNNPHDFITIDRNMVLILNKVDENKPHANFVCKLCNYYCDHYGVVLAHINKDLHKNLLEEYDEKMTLVLAPPLTYDQLCVLDDLIRHILKHKSINKVELEARHAIGSLVNDFITNRITGCSTQLFGSSVHSIGLRDYPITIDLAVPDKSTASSFLQRLTVVLGQSQRIQDVVEHFDKESPFISFYYSRGKRTRICMISLFNEPAINLTNLLKQYNAADDRLAALATLFCLWGEIVDLSKPEHGVPDTAFFVLTVFYLQHCDPPVLPILSEYLKRGVAEETPNLHRVLNHDMSSILTFWRRDQKNKSSVAELWIGMLRFYTVTAPINQVEVLLDEKDIIPRQPKKIYIADPFQPTSNLLRNLTPPMFDYMMKCLAITCKYFIIPQTYSGPLFKGVRQNHDAAHPAFARILEEHEFVNAIILEQIISQDPIFIKDGDNNFRNQHDLGQLITRKKFKNIDNIPLDLFGPMPPRHLYKDMCVTKPQACELVSRVLNGYLEYKFTKTNLAGGMLPPTVCLICRAEGHVVDRCPQAILPRLNSLDCIEQVTINNLTDICEIIFEKFKQPDKEVQMREKVCTELETFIKNIYPTARLVLFGSTKNGFGLRGSDMDICLMFEDDPTGETVDIRAFIEKLYMSLKQLKSVHNVLPITTAKVPIIKFRHTASHLDGDISLYNMLAMENSKMLCTYSLIDRRVQVLGFMMKRFSKVCNIGDASKGGLSSYGYILMVIYFLQQCDPPLLPVLQELTKGKDPRPVRIVEGRDAYFYDDLSQLKDVWPDLGKNNWTEGSLWLRLLIFYTRDFDFQNNVICIRRKEPLTKFQKLWITKEIAIEDPFDLEHNIGARLSRRMSLYIVKSFIKGLNHFTSLLPDDVRTREVMEDYYFKTDKLTDGEPPNERGCRFCKSSSHKERTCTLKRNFKSKAKIMDELVKTRTNKEGARAKSVSNSSGDEDDYLSSEQKSPGRRNESAKPKSDSRLYSHMAGNSVQQPIKPQDNTVTQLPPPGFTVQDAYGGMTLYEAHPNINQYVQSSNNESPRLPLVGVPQRHPLPPSHSAPSHPPPGFARINHHNNPPSEYFQGLPFYPTTCPPFNSSHFVSPAQNTRRVVPRDIPPRFLRQTSPHLFPPRLANTFNKTDDSYCADTYNRNNNA